MSRYASYDPEHKYHLGMRGRWGDSIKPPVILVDFDETLVEAFPAELVQGLAGDWSQAVDVNVQGDLYKALLRPGAPEFLRELNYLGDVYIFSAADMAYLKAVLRTLPAHLQANGVFSSRRDDGYLANLIEGRPFVLIDDLPYNSDVVQDKLEQTGQPFSEQNHIQPPAFTGTWDDVLLDNQLLRKVEKVFNNMRKRV